MILFVSFKSQLLNENEIAKSVPSLSSLSYSHQQTQTVKQTQKSVISPASLSTMPKVSEEELKLSDGGGKGKNNSDDGLLDIRTLREKSRNLDLPLISALCNDRSLLKQTNAFVMPKHPSADSRPLSWHARSASSKKLPDTKTSNVEGCSSTSDNSPKKSSSSIFSSFLSSKSSRNLSTPSKYGTTTSCSKLKYPVSGLSTNQIVKPVRKATTSCHIHPSDTKVQGQTKVNCRGNNPESSKGLDTLLPQ